MLLPLSGPQISQTDMGRTKKQLQTRTASFLTIDLRESVQLAFNYTPACFRQHDGRIRQPTRDQKELDNQLTTTIEDYS